MPTNQSCPDVGKLSRYAVDSLDSGDTIIVDRHLSECRSCLDRLVELGRRSIAPDVPGCRVIKEIGRGRFGVVYKAWSLTGEPRIVALKILSQSGDMEKSRFDREIRVLKKLDSPGIVKCIESGTTRDLTYYTMEYVEGVHLDEYFESPLFDLKAKLTVFHRVCRAVADAHDMGVVHRDLKPKNILIDEKGQPHILDFGVCALESDDWSSSARGTLTHLGDVIGTLKYMSPEQAWAGAAGAVDERSDIWALGVMLYGLVTNGGYPYSLRSTPDKPVHEALLERIRKELPQIPKLDSLPHGRDLQVLLQRCLAWEPDRRLASAATLADDLERYCHDRRIKTKPQWFPYRLKRIAVGAAARSRWTFSILFISAAITLVWALALLFDVGWLGSGHEYQGRTSPSNAATALMSSHDEIVVAGVYDDTTDAVVAFASSNEFEGVTFDVRSWRAVHGYFMKRLVDARPRVLIWDYYFKTPRPADAQFVAGVNELERAGIPVVLAALTYTKDGEPNISPNITDALGTRLRHGVIVARNMIDRPGEFITAVRQKSGSLVPSLALTTLAAALHPETRLDIHWASRSAPIQLLYEIGDGAYRRERDSIATTKAFVAGRPEIAIRVGDLLGCNTFELDHPDRWESRTLRYDTLLTCEPGELRVYVEGKILLVGDLRMPRWGQTHDRHRVKYGNSIVQNVPGVYLQADAIAGLLGGRYVELAFPLSPGEFGMMLAAAIVGCLVPFKLTQMPGLHRPIRRRAIGLLLAGAAAAAFLALMLSRNYVVVHAGMFGVALFVPMMGSLWVEFTRNRHRITDSKHNPLDLQTLTTVGTLTLPRRKSSQATA